VRIVDDGEMQWNRIAGTLLALSSTLGACGGDDTSGSGEIRIIVKLDPHPWFDRLKEGVVAGALDFSVVATMVGPTELITGTAEEKQAALVQGQIDQIHEAIQDRVAVIGVVPNDATLLAPALAEANAAGIIVLTHEQPDVTVARWDVETIDNQRFAERAMQSLGDLIGGAGQVGHFVGGADLHRYWNTTARTYAQNTWGANVQFVSIETDGVSPTACAENAADCKAAMATLLTQYPGLSGILTFGSQGAIGAGQQLKDIARADVAVVGVAVPSQASDDRLMQDGWIDRGFLWDPRDAGYVLVAIGDAIARGIEPDANLIVGDLGAATVNPGLKNIYFNKILELTPENVATFPF
jgi:simple sugar transport system substrate-binding protein